MTATEAEYDGATRALHPTMVGARHPQFASGSRETIYAIEVDHPSGRWEQIWVLRDEALANRIVAALATTPSTPGLDVQRLRKALDLCGIGLAEGGRPASEWADALAREYAALGGMG